jgi:hypothetical protein
MLSSHCRQPRSVGTIGSAGTTLGRVIAFRGEAGRVKKKAVESHCRRSRFLAAVFCVRCFRPCCQRSGLLFLGDFDGGAERSFDPDLV